jgi:hypothetical protein
VQSETLLLLQLDFDVCVFSPHAPLLTLLAVARLDAHVLPAWQVSLALFLLQATLCMFVTC